MVEVWPGGAVRLCRAVGKCGEWYSGVAGGAGLRREMQGGAGAVRVSGAGVATDGGPRRASAWGQPRYSVYHELSLAYQNAAGWIMSSPGRAVHRDRVRADVEHLVDGRSGHLIPKDLPETPP